MLEEQGGQTGECEEGSKAVALFTAPAVDLPETIVTNAGMNPAKDAAAGAIVTSRLREKRTTAEEMWSMASVFQIRTSLDVIWHYTYFVPLAKQPS